MRNTAVRRVATRRDAVGEFLAQTSPRLLIAAVVVAAVTRLLRGDWGTADAIGAAVVVAQWPLLEWVLHVFLLHVRPRGPVTNAFDWAIGRSHRQHHASPTYLKVQFI